MPEQPQVSVIVPNRNRREILSRCLEALARQTHPSFEVIVVDDCSTDDSPQFLADFAENHPGLDFRWLRNDVHLGANPSRNRGIHTSRGAFVAFLDNDCIAEPEWLERLLAGFVSPRVAAVTGRVDDPPPKNIFELTFKGSHRVHGRTHATRLVAGNMCVRRELLLKHTLDEDRAAPSADQNVSGRGDEEGLFLMLRAAGHEQHVVPDAIVYHEHHYTGRTFFRQAYRGGRSAARLGYKYGLRPRIELTPLLLAYIALVPGIWHPFGWAISALSAGFFLAAILYNEFLRKRKTVGEVLITFPVLLAYYHARLAGYVVQGIGLWCGRDRPQRVRLR